MFTGVGASTSKHYIQSVATGKCLIVNTANTYGNTFKQPHMGYCNRDAMTVWDMLLPKTSKLFLLFIHNSLVTDLVIFFF